MVTVYRDAIPLQISYSLMVSLETIALLFCSQSLWFLYPGYKAAKGIVWVIGVAGCFFIAQEFLRHVGGGGLTLSMSMLTALTWIFVNLFCFYSAWRVSKSYQNKFFLIFIALIFLSSSLLFLFRAINMITANAYSVFEPQTYNFIIYFGIAILSSFRNLIYIILRMHLGFAEHSRLNNMNVSLNNVLQERDRMILSLARLNKSAAINALASTVAHEVNQPLGASKIDAQFALHLIKEKPGNLIALQAAIESLVGNIDRASRIIRDLSNLSRRSNLAEEDVSINELLLGVTQISKGRCRNLGIHIEFREQQDFFVRANSGELQQVFINLINNAIDELEIAKVNGGKIEISVKKVENFAQISVQDNGRGVPPGKEVVIFELLNTYKDGGSGIGLWLSQYIISRWSGKIWYEPAPGGGSRFITKLSLFDHEE